MKQIEVTDRLAHYIELHRDNREHIANTESILLDAMVALSYAREAFDTDKEKLECVSSAETAVTELYFILKQIRESED